MAEVSSQIVKDDRAESRRKLPLKMNSIVEKDFGDNRYLISDANSSFSLELFERQIVDAFKKASEGDHLLKPKLDEIKVGDVYLHHATDLQLHRVEVMAHIDKYVMGRLIDYGVYDQFRYENLVCLDIPYFDAIRSVKPFVTRVNLPPNDVLRSLGLPTSSMICEGDFVDVILLTASAPHLAVFGLSRSDTYRVTPQKLTVGLTQEEKTKWLSLFDAKEMYLGASILPHGFGNLKERDLHDNRLAIVSFMKSLDKVYVHDLESSLRLSLMRDRLSMLYEDKKSRKHYEIGCEEDVLVGSGVVAWHEKSKSYIRVEVIGTGMQNFEVAPVDSPNLGCFDVEKKDIYKLPNSLTFPRQSFAVRMTRSEDQPYRYQFNKLARQLLPDKTAVVLNSGPKLGLTKIVCASAPKGVLSKIGYFPAKANKFGESKGVVEFGRPFNNAQKLAMK